MPAVEIQNRISQGEKPEALLQAAKNITTSQDPDIDPYDILDLFHSLKPDSKNQYSRDDKGMARLFADCYKHIIRYNTTAKCWYHYNGKIWEPDKGGMYVAGNAKAFAEGLVFYSFQLPDGAEKKDFIKFASRYGDYGRRKTLVEDARSEMFFSNEDLDRDGNLYGCQNGVFNLETGEFLQHSAEYLLSKISNVVYNPDATAPLFNRFLTGIMQNDAEKTVYLQKHCGLALTEDTSEEHMLFLYGPTTRNGKTTLLETLSFMHGSDKGYCLSMPPEVLAQRKNKDSRAASGDIARLDGCRMLISSEPPKRMLFDAGLIKQLLGRDTITARNLYEREFQFIPKFKLFISCNSLPVIADDTLFTSGRLQVLEFTRHFSAEEQDTTLKNRLRSPDEISGIFNWCLEGLKLYRETGLKAPGSVVIAVQNYREASDKIANFITECLEKTGRNTGAGTVYQAYRNWCLDCGFGTESKRAFFDELKTKGIFAAVGTVNGVTVKNVVTGYELIPDDEPPLPEPPKYGRF